MNAKLLLAPVLASFVLSAQPADACGPYSFAPQLFRVSTHYVDGGTRSFVITNLKVAEDQPWVRLAPMTYDYAGIVDVADPDGAVDFTLVGPSGAKLISSKRQVNISRTFVSHSPAVAFEIRAPKGEVAIALSGKHADATWISLGTERTASASDLAWVAAQGVTPMQRDYVHVNTLAGTDLETITVLPKQGEMVTLVRRGKDLYTRFVGSPMGGVTTDGERFIVGGKYGEALRAIAI